MQPATLIEIQQTETHARWFAALRDAKAKARTDIRIRRLSIGNPGDAKSVGGSIMELRIEYGPGYRLYFTRRGDALVLLLTVGDKLRQQADIALVRTLAEQSKAD